MKFPTLFVEICISIGLLFSVSCDDSASTPVVQQTHPQLPPSKSASIDLSIFSSEKPDSNAAGNYENYEEAVASISKVQSVINRNINRSMNLFENADTADAKEIGDGKYQWSFSKKPGNTGLKTDVRLIAQQQQNKKVEWQLFVSGPQTQNNQEVLYLSGMSNQEVTNGEWTYHSMSGLNKSDQDMAKLDWQTDDNGDVKLQLKLLVEGSFSGSVLNYQTKGSTRKITLDPSSQSNTVIQFNSDTNSGYIIAPDFKDGKKACWNSDFKNVDCSKDS